MQTETVKPEPTEPEATEPQATEPEATEPQAVEPEELDPGSAFLIQAFDPANRANPYPLYAEMRAAQPVLNGGPGLWFTFSHEVAHTLLRSRNTSSDERKSNEFLANVAHDERLQAYQQSDNLMLFTDPPDHTRLRSLVSRAFTPRTVERLRPRLEQLAVNLLQRIDGAGPVNFVEAVAYQFPVTIICELLGVPVEDIEQFQSMSDDMTLMLEPNALRSAEQEAQVERASEDLSAYIEGLLAERRKRPGDDLISGLLAARDGDDRLSEPELVNMVILLLLAGHETTVNLIGNSAVALLRHPDEMRRWQDQPGIAPNAVDELTRFDSPVQMAMRVLLEPTEMHGQTLPAGDEVITLLGAANRDPAQFENPDSLDLTRSNAGSNMSFGGGIHHCLGMSLARTEAEVVLGELISNYDIDLVAEPTMRDRFVLRGYDSVMIEARHR